MLCNEAGGGGGGGVYSYCSETASEILKINLKQVITTVRSTKKLHYTFFFFFVYSQFYILHHKFNFSSNNVTIADLVAGEEYMLHMLAESAFGRNSSQLTIVRSLYTDVVNLTNGLTSNRLQTSVVFNSGVGATVEMQLQYLDLGFTRRQRKPFRYGFLSCEQKIFAIKR